MAYTCIPHPLAPSTSCEPYRTDPKAAYVHMEADGQLSYHQFAAVPHPDMRPMAYSSGFNMMGL